MGPKLAVLEHARVIVALPGNDAFLLYSSLDFGPSCSDAQALASFASLPSSVWGASRLASPLKRHSAWIAPLVVCLADLVEGNLLVIGLVLLIKQIQDVLAVWGKIRPSFSKS